MSKKGRGLYKQLLIKVCTIGSLCGGWPGVPDGRLLFHRALLMQQDATAVTWAVPRGPSASQHSCGIRASAAAIVTRAHLAPSRRGASPTTGLVLAKGNTGIQNVNSHASVNKSLQLSSGFNRRGWRGPYTSLRKGERELLIILTQDNTPHDSYMHSC